MRRGRRPRRPGAAERERGAEGLRRLRERYPDASCALHHRDAYQLLVATILSAQCTDERVNMVTPEFFARWPTPAALARADRADVEAVIHSTGFFRNKAKHLQGMARGLLERHDGEVPRALEDLVALPGVARKTANVVRGVMWGLADGVVVDTHVLRISRRLGWTDRGDPGHVEQDLMALFPEADWIDLAHVLIQHGRTLCTARSPRCPPCPVMDLCPSARLFFPREARPRRR